MYTHVHAYLCAVTRPPSSMYVCMCVCVYVCLFSTRLPIQETRTALQALLCCRGPNRKDWGIVKACHAIVFAYTSFCIYICTQRDMHMNLKMCVVHLYVQVHLVDIVCIRARVHATLFVLLRAQTRTRAGTQTHSRVYTREFNEENGKHTYIHHTHDCAHRQKRMWRFTFSGHVFPEFTHTWM